MFTKFTMQVFKILSTFVIYKIIIPCDQQMKGETGESEFFQERSKYCNEVGYYLSRPNRITLPKTSSTYCLLLLNFSFSGSYKIQNKNRNVFLLLSIH